MRSLFSGLVRANTAVSRAMPTSASSEAASTSAPVTTFGSSARPSWRAMACAVAPWSPVIIFTPMPAVRHSAMAATASGRGGSMKPTRPRKAKPWRTSSGARRCGAAASSRFMAKPSTRSPSAAVWASAASQPAPGVSHIASTASGAPLTKITASPCGPRCRLAMKR